MSITAADALHPERSIDNAVALRVQWSDGDVSYFCVAPGDVAGTGAPGVRPKIGFACAVVTVMSDAEVRAALAAGAWFGVRVASVADLTAWGQARITFEAPARALAPSAKTA
jgi:hypothetical protein